jgi:uncharacterized membrane protein YjgN (DUF898 family)
MSSTPQPTGNDALDGPGHAGADGVPTDDGAAPSHYRFEFAGSGGEYFRIWIVNLLLSVLTLGIYSAWAKVRREKYFHRNTLLAGGGFDYHGDPRAILKGRLIAWGLLAAMSLSQRFNPTLYGILVLGAIPVAPWFLVRSLKFRAANSSYRGLRFHHAGTYREGLGVFAGHGLLTMLSAGLWLPMWMRAVKRFQLGKLSYGGAGFRCEPGAAGFVGAYFVAGLLLVLPLIAGGFLVGAAAAATRAHARGQGILLASAVFIPFLIMGAYALLARPFIQVRLANLTWNAAGLGEGRFAASQAFPSFWRLRAANILLTILTLGLYWPWAKVREAAYRARHLSVTGADLDAFVGQAQELRNAVGEEIADAFDLDFSL